MLSAGQSLGLIDRIAPLAELVSQLEQEAKVAFNRLHPSTPVEPVEMAVQ